jgi:hypothetical protein
MCGAPVPSLPGLAHGSGHLPDVAERLFQRLTDIRFDRARCNAYSFLELAYIDAVFDAPLLLQGDRAGKKAIEALLYCGVNLRFPGRNVGELQEVAGMRRTPSPSLCRVKTMPARSNVTRMAANEEGRAVRAASIRLIVTGATFAARDKSCTVQFIAARAIRNCAPDTTICIFDEIAASSQVSVTGAGHTAVALHALILGAGRAARGCRRRARQHQHHKRKDEFHGDSSPLHLLARGLAVTSHVHCT